MSDYVTLLGAKAVQSAGHSIRAAADRMNATGSQIEDSLRRAVDEFGASVDRLPTFRDLVLASCLHAELNREGGDAIASCLEELGLHPETVWESSIHWPRLCLKRAEAKASTIFLACGR